jgi:zinc/manganese transport system substrate-binding protein
MPPFSRRSLLVLSAATLLSAAATRAQDRLPVVATFSILADLVSAVGGDRLSVGMLVGHDADAHVYRPTPADARKLADARLIVANGLGFEGFLDRLVRSSGTRARVVVASDGIERLASARAAGHGQSHGHDHGHSHGRFDPHAWQSVSAVRRYVTNIRDALSEADPAGREHYASRTGAYLAELATLEAEIRAVVARIPPERRRVVTGHNAFRYFGRDFGLTFVALQGVSTEQEPSARDIANVVRQIRKERIGAIFLETLTNPKLVEQVSRESGAVVGGALISDALTGPEGVAPTWLALMRHNAGVLAKALVPAG